MQNKKGNFRIIFPQILVIFLNFLCIQMASLFLIPTISDFPGHQLCGHFPFDHRGIGNFVNLVIVSERNIGPSPAEGPQLIPAKKNPPKNTPLGNVHRDSPWREEGVKQRLMPCWLGGGICQRPKLRGLNVWEIAGILLIQNLGEKNSVPSSNPTPSKTRRLFLPSKMALFGNWHLFSSSDFWIFLHMLKWDRVPFTMKSLM